MSSLEMLEKLEEFFCSPKFTCAIGDFMSENAEKLEFVPLDGEQPLQNFDIFKNYTSMVEQQLEEFIQAEGLSVKAICDACAAAQNNENHMHIAAIDYLVASTEYESFMQLAYDHACMAAYEPNELTAWDPEEEAAGPGEVPIAVEAAA
ncbi:hypothetical protein HYH02_005822 [Chlamydomonas schloesseri]|uniref:Cilia- and flagella-associated protein 36 n=1 Tax=Chlamydomonas schloesseri TaxID=2026947 RepID=A0A835WKQ5_9CHLO|nr:hypothetical protein HYH02_005822 [Chlamydomonas schloesseri]|eukprot:KAG2449073.1 hypothetical protein HYH02_005822 [Chlamydomonas schloesseri]